MDQNLIDRIKEDVRYEFSRSGPPEGFPKFPDIPTGRHTSDEFFALEQDHIWSDVWVLAGREDDVANPGDYFLFSKLGVPLIVVRGTDGGVRCFNNTCQHRGAPIVRKERGSAQRLRCQYHSWTYEIDGGTLVSVPDERDFVDLDKSLRCLKRASCEVFCGFIFINRNPDATPLREWLGDAAELLLPYDGAKLEVIYQRSEIVPCNWKVTAEAFMEVYHFKHIHNRKGGPLLDSDGAAMGLYRNGHSRMITPFSEQIAAQSGMDGWDDWKPIDQGPFPIIPTVPDIVKCTSTALSLFPNIIIPFFSTGFPINLYWPIDKGSTRFEWIYYAIKDWEGDELPERWKARQADFDLIQEEDMENMAPMQNSLESGALTGIPTSYQERRLWHLHEQIDRMIGIDNVPPQLRVEQLLDPYVEDPD